MECLFPRLGDCLSNNWWVSSTSKGCGQHSPLTRKFSGLFHFCSGIVYRFHGVSCSTKSQNQKKAANSRSYQYLLFNSRYLYSCKPYRIIAFQRMVALLFGLGYSSVRYYTQDFLYRQIRSFFIGVIWCYGLVDCNRPTFSDSTYVYIWIDLPITRWCILYDRYIVLCHKKNTIQSSHMAFFCVGRRY